MPCGDRRDGWLAAASSQLACARLIAAMNARAICFQWSDHNWIGHQTRRLVEHLLIPCSAFWRQMAESVLRHFIP